MKFFSIFLLSITLVSAQNSQQEVSLTPEKAIIFRNSAQVFSTSSVTLEEGNNVLIYKGLTPRINTQNIVVSGLKGASVNKILFSTDYLLTPSVQKELEQVKQQLNDVMRTKNKVTNHVNALDTEKEVLQKNQLAASNENNASLEKLKAYATYYRNRFEEINNLQYELRLQLEQLTGEQNALQRQKNQLESEVRENRGVLTLHLHAPKKITTQLKLNFQVYDAGWSPSYELRATDANAPISFLYQAEVFQHTGTDWNSIDLYLSTGNPRSRTVTPTLFPYYLNFYEAPVVLRNEANDDLKEVVISSYRVQQKDLSDAVVREETQTSIIFHLGKSEYLASSNHSSKRTLEQKDIPASFTYQAFPSITKDVFLQAEISDWQALDLVSGVAKLYLEDAYAGTTPINATSVDEKLVISFGVDESIRVNHKEIKSNTSKTFFRNQEIREKIYEFEVYNAKSKPITLRVKDQIPVAQNDAIKVEDVQFNAAALDKETGELTWEVKLQPKQNWVERLGYTVKFPKDKRVNLR